MTVDGDLVADNLLALYDDDAVHEVDITLGTQK